METQIELFKSTRPAKRHTMIREHSDYRVATTPENCSIVELLAVIIGGKESEVTANRLLAKTGTIHQLATLPCDEYMVEGIGKKTAIKIKAALELTKKLHSPADFKNIVCRPEEAADLFTPFLAFKEQEVLAVILLDARNRLLKTVEVYTGSLNTAMVRLGEVFKAAIRANAASVIVGHNHPSGDPTPSPEDVALTRGLVNSGKILDIDVLDHIVYGSPGCFKSMKESGMGFY